VTSAARRAAGVTSSCQSERVTSRPMAVYLIEA
jgi:hypothetical protein